MLLDQELKIDLPFFKDKGQEEYETAVVLNSCDRGYCIFTLDD